MCVCVCVCVCRVEGEGPTCKKPRTTNVVVEQAGQTDKLLIDQIADLNSVFEEVYMPVYKSMYGHCRGFYIYCMTVLLSLKVCVCVCVCVCASSTAVRGVAAKLVL